MNRITAFFSVFISSIRVFRFFRCSFVGQVAVPTLVAHEQTSSGTRWDSGPHVFWSLEVEGPIISLFLFEWTNLICQSKRKNFFFRQCLLVSFNWFHSSKTMTKRKSTTIHFSLTPSRARNSAEAQLFAGITSIPLKTHLVRALTVLSLPARRALEETAPERATQKASRMVEINTVHWIWKTTSNFFEMQLNTSLC